MEDVVEGNQNTGANSYLKITAGVWSIDGTKALKKSSKFQLDYPLHHSSKDKAFAYVFPI